MKRDMSLLLEEIMVSSFYEVGHVIVFVQFCCLLFSDSFCICTLLIISSLQISGRSSRWVGTTGVSADRERWMSICSCPLRQPTIGHLLLMEPSAAEISHSSIAVCCVCCVSVLWNDSHHFLFSFLSFSWWRDRIFWKQPMRTVWNGSNE